MKHGTPSQANRGPKNPGRSLPQPGLARGHVGRSGRHRERNNQKQDGTRTAHGVFSHANPAFRIGFAGGR
jgi:hypothetical protein